MPYPISNEDPFLQHFNTLFSTPRKVLIIAHQDPDIDAIGSCLGAALTLKSQGHQTYIWLADRLPKNAEFLPNSSEISSIFPAEKHDIVLMLDCATTERIRGADQLKAYRVANADVPFINIDHHLENTVINDYAWVETRASSTGEMLVTLFNALGWSLSSDSATCLYAAIAFDTGRFLFSNVTEYTFQRAGQLMALGADFSGVSLHMFESLSKDDLDVKKEALNNLVIVNDSYAYTTVTYLPLNAGIRGIDVIRSLGNISLFLAFTPAEDGSVKVSLRSKTALIDVQKIAAKFGGGGHRQASGISLIGTLDEVKTRVLAYIDTLPWG